MPCTTQCSSYVARKKALLRCVVVRQRIAVGPNEGAFLMKRLIPLLAVAAAAAASVVIATSGGGSAGAGTAAARPAQRGTTVAVRATRLGRMLVDGRGRTLYLFERDRSTT